MVSGIKRPVFCIIGYGSIGRRHASNLKKLGEKVIVYRSGHQDSGAPMYDSELLFLHERSEIAKLADAIVICNPTSMHLEWVKFAIQNNLDFYVEKPICENYQLAKELEFQISQKALVTCSGYMMRYEEGIYRLKKLLDAGALGSIYDARFQWSSFMPDWHPWENYRESYASQIIMGGGVVLTCSHELDTIRYLLGEMRLIGAAIGQSGVLEMDVEDGVDALFISINDVPVYLHMDWYQKIPLRNLAISCTKGILKWDFISHTLSLDGKNPLDSFCISLGSDVNEMYIECIKDFASCVRTRGSTRVDFSDGLQTLFLCSEIKEKGVVYG